MASEFLSAGFQVAYILGDGRVSTTSQALAFTP
jgi:hypothetical protein